MQQLIYCGLVAAGIFIGIGLSALAMKLSECPWDDYDWEEEDDL